MNKANTQKQIIEQLKKNPIIQLACEKYNLPRATFYRWKKQFKKFGEEVDIAIAQGRYLVNDMAESQLMNAIKDGNITACIYWLKSNSPNYSTKIEVNANHRVVDGTISKEQEEIIKQAIRLISPKIEEVPPDGADEQSGIIPRDNQ